jgi:hypothetical protein
MTRGLVQTGGLARHSDSAPRKALRRSSNAAPRCLEPASTTDVSRHEHPRMKHHLWRLSTERRGKPASVRLRDRPRGRGVSAVSSEDGTGPPCGHPASSSSALDGTSLASGRPTLRPSRSRARAGTKSAAAFSAAGDSAESNPLTPLFTTGARTRERPLSRSTELPSSRGTSMRRPSRSSRCLPPRKTRRRLFRAPSSALPPLASGAVAARFHRCSKNLD